MSKYISYLAVCLIFISTMMMSCTYENSEIIEEIIEEIPDGLEVTIRGETINYDAYAAYCNSNGIESFTISNNPDLLNNQIWTEILSEEDFIINYRKEATSEYTISGAAFETVFMGETILFVSQDLDNVVLIEDANSSHIIGSLDGSFVINLETGEEATYSANFAAEVIPGIIPVLCN